MKVVKTGIVYMLMRIFDRWDRFDGPLRLKICNNALNTLQHISTISKSVFYFYFRKEILDLYDLY